MGVFQEELLTLYTTEPNFFTGTKFSTGTFFLQEHFSPGQNFLQGHFHRDKIFTGTFLPTLRFHPDTFTLHSVSLHFLPLQIVTLKFFKYSFLFGFPCRILNLDVHYPLQDNLKKNGAFKMQVIFQHYKEPTSNQFEIDVIPKQGEYVKLSNDTLWLVDKVVHKPCRNQVLVIYRPDTKGVKVIPPVN